MLAYLASKQQFLQDAPIIEDKVAEKVKELLNLTVGRSEFEAWRNSLGNAMYHVMNDPGIPGDATVAIEYRLNGRRFRIDFLIQGEGPDGRGSLVIVELKQWSEVEYSALADHVRTFVGGAKRDERHPSYQAWSYASHLSQFNEYVYENGFAVESCAYLHNCVSDIVLRDSRFEHLTHRAPIFKKGEFDELRSFVKQRIVRGSSADVMRKIDASPMRPSNQLAESIGRMLRGNEEFVLLDEQKTVMETIVNASTRGMVEGKQVLVVKGGPGTGKSVIAMNALSRLSALRMNARYVTPNAAPRAVFEEKLKGAIPGGDIRQLFSGSASYTGVGRDSYDVLLVDEAHRLKLRSQYAKGGVNQIKEIIEAARTTVFFIDEAQKVTWLDIGEIAAIEEFAAELGAEVDHLELSSQFRCGGSDDYMAWIDGSLGVAPRTDSYFSTSRFDFRVFDDPSELFGAIKMRNKINGKSRLVAGYCWDWVSRKGSGELDIVFPEYRFEADWNLQTHGSAWIVKDESIDEVGCIHTCQGLELDYVGVIVGADLVFRNGRIETDPSARAKTDKSLHGYKKALKERPDEARRKADRIIRNTYRTLLTRGMKGCFVYFSDPALAQHFRELVDEID